MKTTLKTTISSIIKGRTVSALMTAAAMLLSTQASAEVSQAPLSLAIGVAPNMLLTLDDSGSMRFAFAPDSIGSERNTRRVKSSTYNQMYYNPEITYEIPPFFNDDGSERQLSTSFGEAYHNGFVPSVGSVNLAREYRVSWDVPVNKKPSDYSYDNSTNYAAPTGRLYRLAENPSQDFGCSGWWCSSSKTRTGVPAYYYRFNHNSCSNNSSSLANDDCYLKVDVTGTSEEQNFAIWYSFYRNRALATLSAAAIAFAELDTRTRISWQALNACASFDNSSNSCKSSFGPYTTARKGNLYRWFRTMPFDDGTPLRAALKRAGEFYQGEKAWQFNPGGTGNDAENMYACRASYHILMTDGMWNGTVSSISADNFKHDNASFNLPDGTRYTPRAPYRDSTSNTLADLAMHYWANDLKDIGDYKVPARIPFKNPNPDVEYWDPRNNPATWRNMVNFVLGLALSNSLNKANIPWEEGTHVGKGYENLLSGTAWPQAGSGKNENVYDLWHAAINSRGEFYSVDSPEGMVNAFKDIMGRIAEREATASKPGVSSSMEEIDDPFGGDDSTERLGRYFYHTSYDSAGWSGDLRKTRLVRECVAHEIEGTDPDDPEMALECEEVASDGWRASEKLPAHGARNIKISNGSSLVDFKAAGVNSVPALRTELSKQLPNRPTNQTSTMQEHINYLRGDRSLETSRPELFRARNGVLGDMLGSSPAFAGGPKYISQVANKIDSGYEALVTKANNRPSMIYVGANDGMLHGFDAETGVEKFAFIPTAVFGKLRDYIDIGYSHRFYVDGTPVIADAYDGTEWRTILVGTLGAGGKGIFALDITEPGEDGNGIKLLWELNEGDVSGDVQPGYSFPEPTVARMHNGKWAVITGNGYEGAGTNNGKAALFVIDAFTGETRSLEVQGETGSRNGLSTPRVVDLDGDGVADYAYAGDLQGNLWRFDLLGEGAYGPNDDNPNGYFGGKNDGNGSTFKPSYGGKPLYTATGQSITAPPTVVRHPSGVGYMVVVGTGKYFEVGDDETTALNSLYGIWDRNTRGPSDLGDHVAVTRDNLQKQEVTTQSRSNNAASGVERDVRVLSSNNVDWANAGNSSGKLGWYLDLRFSDNQDGEMVIEGMRTLGNMLLFQTLLPNDDPCADGSSTWLYALNPATGGATDHDPFGYDKVNGGVVSGISFGSEGGFSLSQGELDFSVHSGGEKERINPPPEAMGRQTWRLIHNP